MSETKKIALDVQDAYDQAVALEEAWGCFRRVLEERAAVCMHPEAEIRSVEIEYSESRNEIIEICGACDRVIRSVRVEE